MSTKTTLKRIALVAVSALGFGILTSTAPANANGAVTPTAVAVGTIPATAVGVDSIIPMTVTAPLDAAIDTMVVVVRVTSAPAGSAFVGSAARGFASLDSSTIGASYIEGVFAAGNTIAAKLNLDQTSGTAVLRDSGNVQKTDLTPSVAATFTATGWTSASSNTNSFRVLFTPDVAGSYSFIVSTKVGGTALNTATYAAGDPNVTFSVTTGATPATVTLAGVGSAPIAASSNGQLIKVTLKDASGNPATLGINETLNIAPNATTTTLRSVNPLTAGNISAAATGTAGLTLGSADFITPGTAYVRLTDSSSTSKTIVLTASGSGQLSSGVTTTVSVTTSANVDSASITLGNPTGATRPGSGKAGIAGTSSYTDRTSTASASHSYLVTDTASCTAAATKKISTSILDSAGAITGVVGITVDGPSVTLTCGTAGTSSTGTVTVSGALSDEDDAFTLTVGATGSKALVVTAEDSVVNSAAVSPATSIKMATGGSIVLTARVTDQFGAAMANRAVVVSVSGRNATASNVNLATDSTGRVSYTLADASTSTTNLTDTVTFTATGAASQTAGANVATISYGTFAAETITITGGNTVASVANATDTINPISAGDGVEAGAITFTATVKDVNGAVLAGVPVTFSVDGTGVAVLSTTQTVYTTSAGTASTSVYAWITGKYTVTATSGVKSTTGTATFASTTAANARVVSATVAGNVVTGKVVDRFGNPVSGVTLYASATAPANIGGAFRTSGVTASDGTIAWVVSGSGSVTVSAVDPTAIAGTTFGQTCALVGNRTCASGSTAAVAFTASTVGTALIAETYVGASLAPAGVASATVEVTGDTAALDAANAASDAAAEAIDAANAATDAANLAAEAADAATVAAEEARDAADAATAAVEELATQVATLMAALKAQITTLANTVAKIAKKVKA